MVLKNEQFIQNYVSEAKEVLSRLPLEKIDTVIEIFFDSWKNDKQVFFIGNGGSASNASHFAADLSKTTVMHDDPSSLLNVKRFKAFSLCDTTPLLTAWANDVGFEGVFRGQLENLLQPGDILVGLSSRGGKKGTSNNLGEAFRYAKSVGAKTIGFSGFDGGEMNNYCDINVVVPINDMGHSESFHSFLQHLITFCLIEKLANYKKENGL